MRPIKFRGRTLGGELVYGYYVYDDLFVLHQIFDMYGEGFVIDPESVAQLVGYDRNGREVYEGDKLINDSDYTIFKAAMNLLFSLLSFLRKKKYLIENGSYYVLHYFYPFSTLFINSEI